MVFASIRYETPTPASMMLLLALLAATDMTLMARRSWVLAYNRR
jgi:hypothetical protein